jgi:23S rRNA (pseudouridine1915-N3)-methyltransferase
MRIRIVAVGPRQPAWVNDAFADYAKRLKSALPVELVELPTSNRVAEAKRIMAALPERSYNVALDERGKGLSTLALSRWLETRRGSGTHLSFILGGPDGIAPDVIKRCCETLSLSALTLPHGLARVLLVEQLYRAHSIIVGHPYHRP